MYYRSLYKSYLENEDNDDKMSYSVFKYKLNEDDKYYDDNSDF